MPTSVAGTLLTVTNEVSVFAALAPSVRNAARALEHLVAAAGPGPAGGQRVVVLLELVADQVASEGAPATLPEQEQALWASVGADFSDPGSVGRSEARSAVAFADMVSRSVAGDAAIADLLGVNRSRVSQRLAERSLYWFGGPRGERYYPTWQFDGAEPVPKPLRGLREVLLGLDTRLHPLVVDHWARTPNLDLVVDGEPMAPVQWLRTGGDPGRLSELLPQP